MKKTVSTAMPIIFLSLPWLVEKYCQPVWLATVRKT
jgi:hypothetical protein